MPRQDRFDVPGTLHHVMIRGIERKAIFEGELPDGSPRAPATPKDARWGKPFSFARYAVSTAMRRVAGKIP